MKEIDEKTQQALLLFNRRAETAEKESQAANELKKAEKIKDEAVVSLQKAKDSGSDPEVIAEAEAAWRNALDIWQRLSDGEDIEETPEEQEAPLGDPNPPVSEPTNTTENPMAPANEQESEKGG